MKELSSGACKQVVYELVAIIKDKASYPILQKGQENAASKDFQKGMATAYHLVLDEIINYITLSDELTLEDVGLNDLDANDILFDSLS